MFLKNNLDLFPTSKTQTNRQKTIPIWNPDLESEHQIWSGFVYLVFRIMNSQPKIVELAYCCIPCCFVVQSRCLLQNPRISRYFFKNPVSPSSVSLGAQKYQSKTYQNFEVLHDFLCSIVENHRHLQDWFSLPFSLLLTNLDASPNIVLISGLRNIGAFDPQCSSKPPWWELSGSVWWGQRNILQSYDVMLWWPENKQ